MGLKILERLGLLFCFFLFGTWIELLLKSSWLLWCHYRNALLQIFLICLFHCLLCSWNNSFQNKLQIILYDTGDIYYRHQDQQKIPNYF